MTMPPTLHIGGTSKRRLSLQRLSHQPHSQGCTNTADRIETRLAAGSKRLVQGLPRDARVFRNLRHTPCAGNVTERCSQQRRVVFLKNGREVGRHILVVGISDSLIFLVMVQSSKELASWIALLMSPCCDDLSPPPSITIKVLPRWM